MCGIAGFLNFHNNPHSNGAKALKVMGELLEHRGPDDSGEWLGENHEIGLSHRRLSIIDLSETAAQPMHGLNGTIIVLNGEIYNYLELRESLASSWDFRSSSDTETILAAYAKYGENCVEYLRGMFAFAIWDSGKKKLFCARDRFGIKPFYYAVIGEFFYFASEAKALLPFLLSIATEPSAMAEYLTFNFAIGDNTMFKGVKQLLPGHTLNVKGSNISVSRYWDVSYEIDWTSPKDSFPLTLGELVKESIDFHLRSDVPVGSYVSGGIDSSLMTILASQADAENREAFHGRFLEYPGYDESDYAQLAVDASGSNLNLLDITSEDFRENLSKVIYHLDYPVAGPGSFLNLWCLSLLQRKLR